MMRRCLLFVLWLTHRVFHPKPTEMLNGSLRNISSDLQVICVLSSALHTRALLHAQRIEWDPKINLEDMITQLCSDQICFLLLAHQLEQITFIPLPLHSFHQSYCELSYLSNHRTYTPDMCIHMFMYPVSHVFLH